MLLAAQGAAPAGAQTARLPAVVAECDELPRMASTGLPPAQPYVDLDAYLDSLQADEVCGSDEWCWQILPDGLIYPAYLAGLKESRLSTHIVHERDDSWLWDATLGGWFGLFRYGTRSNTRPLGIQLDVEGSAQFRLDIPENVDVRATDYRAGVPLTFAYGPHQTKVGYYHLSSHLADEFLLLNPTFPRLNFTRDVLFIGQMLDVTDEVRVYVEAGWAFASEVSQPWEFQFGLDYAPATATGHRGAPFFAVNGHLREEVGFGGGLAVQTGWAWRGDDNDHLLRVGLHYFNGKSNQYSFFNDHEQQLGFGLWYDR